MTSIRRLHEIKSQDVALAGGKGASLGEMVRAGLPVPPGYVVASDAFRGFLEDNGLARPVRAEMGSLAKGRDMAAVKTAAKKIRGLILEAPVPVGIARASQTAFNELGAELVAVRSSAAAE